MITHVPVTEIAAPRYVVGQVAPVTIQPSTVIVNKNKGVWSSGMCSCLEDFGTCMSVTFCGPLGIAGCLMSREMGENCCLPFIPCWIVALRTKLRTQLKIEGSICGDCIASTFCGPCIQCQMWREFKDARKAGRL